MPTSLWRRCAVLLAAMAALLAVLAPTAAAQATRTWVSGVGDDGNPCSRTAPCKTWAGAISKTAAGGLLNALDPGGFGALTITKAITVDGAGTHASVLHSGFSGITVNAGPDDDVVLRDLDINGAGASAAAACPGTTGIHGVNIVGARSVRIEDVSIGNQTQFGVRVAPSAANTKVMLNRVDITNTCGGGVAVLPAAGRTADVIIRDSTIAMSPVGLSVADGGRAFITGSALFGLGTGFVTTGSGTITDAGDNAMSANTTDGVATTTLDDAPVVGPAGPAGSTGPAGPAGAPGPAGPQGESAVKLMVALPVGTMSSRAGRAVTLRYASTVAAASTLTVTRGARTVATVRKAAKAGRNAIRWKGTKRKGRYRLTLETRGADGQSDRAIATVRVR